MKLSILHVARWLTTVLLAILLSSCTERLRDNPFDPENPETGGKPAAPRLTSARDSVLISWQRFDVADIKFYNLYRRLEGEAAFQLINTFSPDVFEYREIGAEFDRERWYRLSVSTASHESPLSDSVRIRPGPTFVWALDISAGDLVKYTHDGEHLIFRSNIAIRPTRLAVNPNTNSALIIDFWAQEVIAVDANGSFTGLTVRNPGATDLEINLRDNSFYVLNEEGGTLQQYSEKGELLITLENMTRPRAIAADPATGEVWVINSGRHEVLQVDFKAQTVFRYPGFLSTYDLAFDARRRVFWAADSASVLRFSPANPFIQLIFSSFRFARKIAVDQNSGACWVIDWHFAPGQSSVVKLNAEGAREFEITGFVDPRALAVNPFNGNCFVTDPGKGELVQISPEGEVISVLQKQGNLLDVSVQMLQ